MQVLFDLRSHKIVQIQERQIDALRLLSMLLFGGFVVISLFNIAFTVINLRDFRGQLDEVKQKHNTVMGQSALVDAEITTLRLYKEKIKAYVAFSKEEMPSVEFLAALEGALPGAVKLTKLDMKPGSVLLKGVAIADQDMVDFGNRLDGMRNIVTNVAAPVTAKTTVGTKILVEFTIPCTIKSVSEVAASMAEMPPQEGTVGEGGSQ